MQADPSKRQGYLILIVDDEPAMRALRRDALEREGFRVVEAENGRQGVEAAIREHPRLVLMNYLMPEMDGLEATRLIRSEASLKSVPILMNSGCSREEMWDNAIRAGCNDYFEEPCFNDEMMRSVMAHILVG